MNFTALDKRCWRNMWQFVWIFQGQSNFSLLINDYLFKVRHLKLLESFKVFVKVSEILQAYCSLSQCWNCILQVMNPVNRRHFVMSTLHCLSYCDILNRLCWVLLANRMHYWWSFSVRPFLSVQGTKNY